MQAGSRFFMTRSLTDWGDRTLLGGCSE